MDGRVHESQFYKAGARNGKRSKTASPAPGGPGVERGLYWTERGPGSPLDLPRA